MTPNTLLIKQLTAALLLLSPTITFAACAFTSSTSNRPDLIQIDMPETITLPRDLASGTILFESSVFTQGPGYSFNCSTPAPFGIKNNLGSAVVGTSEYPIGNTGLSWVVLRSGNASRAYGTITLQPNNYNDIGRTTQIRIIKSGNITQGATIPAGEFGSVVADGLALGIYTSNKITHIVPSACETHNVNVKMGQHRLENFSKDSSAASTAIPFSLGLFNCPTGINSVTYTLTPTSSSPSLSDNQGLIRLTQASTAKGIGLQITDGNLKPVPLNKAIAFNEYSTKGGNFTIPLSARYALQATGTGVVPGTANAEITFTMNYN
ncbi:fimbrial protein [Pseudomonas paralactis]|uniref:fimbrial protein n=1 Tax=Pseudomonas paralactis TaxID=1615673 RepID=UPI0009E6EB0B|nr:fimbrial protein [Pseudomonas paralactis]